MPQTLEKNQAANNPSRNPQQSPSLMGRYRDLAELHTDATAIACLQLLFGDDAPVAMLIARDVLWAEIPERVTRLRQQHISDNSPCARLVRHMSTLDRQTVRARMQQLSVLYQQVNPSLEDFIQAITAAQLYL